MLLLLVLLDGSLMDKLLRDIVRRLFVEVIARCWPDSFRLQMKPYTAKQSKKFMRKT